MRYAPHYGVCETQQRTCTLVTHRLTRLTRGEKTPAGRVVKRHSSRSLFNTTRSNGHVNGSSLLAPEKRENPHHEMNAAVMLQPIRAHHDERPRFDSASCHSQCRIYYWLRTTRVAGFSIHILSSNTVVCRFIVVHRHGIYFVPARKLEYI